MDPKKKNLPPNPQLEKREREFNVYVSGANAERVESLRKKEKHEISHSRSKSKNTRKPWDVGDRQDREPRRSENENRSSQDEAQPKRERRRWGDPQPISFEQQNVKDELTRVPRREIVEETPESDHEAESKEYEESPDGREKRSQEEIENEDIQNFITTMKSGDIEKLRQSLADSFRDDEMKRIAQNNPKKTENQYYDKKEAVSQKKKISNEIDEEIVEDIDENPVDLDFEENKSQNRESFYGGKPISIRKARPISATYNEIGGHRMSEPVYGAIPSQSKQSESKRKLENSGLEINNNQNEFKESVPFQKISFANSSRHVDSPSSTKMNQQKETKDSNFAAKDSKPEQNVSVRSSTKLQPVEEERKSAKGHNPLLKRIEGLDETKKQLLESILDKIEKGELNKEILLNLEFLNIKKNKNAHPDQDVRRSRDQKKDRKQLPSVKDLTLPSNVESKISKIAKKAEQEKTPTKLKIDEEPLRRVEKEKEKVLPEIIPFNKKEEPMKPNFPEFSSKTPAHNLQDSLEQISLPRKSHVNTNINNNNNEHQYYSNPNPEPVVFPEILKRKQPEPGRESVNKTPELRISDANLKFAQDHQLQFRIMSTWGNISQAGLTELQIFNDKGEKIELKPADFHLRNCGLTSIKNISKITDGVIYTTEEDHMWLCTMPAPPTTPEISLTIRGEKNIGGIRIWNYNKSLIESIKGIKELEIIHNRNIVWTGIIDRGPGNEYEAYHTEIILQKGIVLPKVEQPASLNLPYETGRTEQHNQPEKDVPIWLKDTLPRNQPLPTTSFDQKSGSFGRRESERNTANPMSRGGDSSKSLIEKVHGQQELRLEAATTKRQNVSAASSDINRTNDTSKASDSQNKSLTRIRNHPKTELPFKDILDEKSFSRNEERTPRAGETEAQKENVQSGKKDENASINSVEYFNITNFGRLRPAKRESLVQVFNLQQDVLEKVKDVQKRLDFKTSPLEEGMDILTQFDKGMKEDQPKLKLPQQSVEQAGMNIGKRKEVGNKKSTTTTGITEKTKPPVDVFDSMFSKGSVSAKNLPLDLPNQAKSVEAILYDNKSFKIPELPRGRFLKMCIYSTWGDAYYVGLNGIEIFDEKGELIVLQDVNSQIKANPPDINCLPGYGKDPRTVDKLVDGTYLTCDDLHVWLAPFTQGKEHTIDIDFRETKTISLIRVWNYNKSRIHSYRGARDVAIKLDESPIFLGEISKAPGSLKGAQDSCEYIMFTESENILGRIEKNDWLNKLSKHDLVKPDLNATLERPMTGTKRFDENDLKQIKELNPFLGPDGRPLTMAKMTQDNSIRDQIEKNKKELKRLEQQQKLKQEKEKANISKALSILTSSNAQSAEIKCKNIVIIITQSWGDPFYVGLTGLEVYDGEGEKIPINIKNLNAKPKDMNSIPGYSGDQRTLDKLINRHNITTKDENMWLIPFTPKQNHYIYITFEEAKIVSGIRFWNYNKSAENSFRGAKNISISADGVMLTPPNGILLKKAPGAEFYDYSQFVPLPFFDGWDEETVKLYKNIQPQPMQGFLLQEYDTPEFPAGFLYRIKLLSTWGDYDYIGLNGIEFYDHKGERLLAGNQKDYKLAVEPDSVSCLPNHDGDIRTPDKLVNGVNETFDDRNMWLAPYVLERRDDGLFKTDNNEIIVIFDKPKILSCIKFWNYSKTQTRGVREVEILCDDKVIYRGYLRMAPRENENQDKSSLQTSILFTKERDLIKKLDPYIYTEDGKLQKVILNNEKKIINPASESRPQTHVTLERPTTSVKGGFPE